MAFGYRQTDRGLRVFGCEVAPYRAMELSCYAHSTICAHSTSPPLPEEIDAFNLVIEGFFGE